MKFNACHSILQLYTEICRKSREYTHHLKLLEWRAMYLLMNKGGLDVQGYCKRYFMIIINNISLLYTYSSENTKVCFGSQYHMNGKCQWNRIVNRWFTTITCFFCGKMRSFQSLKYNIFSRVHFRSPAQ